MFFAYCMLVLFVGSQGKFTEWLNRDDPNVTGDFELETGFSPKPCGGKSLLIKARIKGDNTVILSSTKNITVGPGYGLSCSNKEQADKMCLDFFVQYMVPGISQKFDLDTPREGLENGDYELKTFDTGALWKNRSFLYWYHDNRNYGLTDEMLYLGPRYGLSCQLEQQPDYQCRDYQVRFLCPAGFQMPDYHKPI